MFVEVAASLVSGLLKQWTVTVKPLAVRLPFIVPTIACTWRVPNSSFAVSLTMASQLRPNESLHFPKDSLLIGTLGVVVVDALPSIVDSSQLTVAKPAVRVAFVPAFRLALMFWVVGIPFASEHGVSFALQNVVSPAAILAPTIAIRAAAATTASPRVLRCFMMSFPFRSPIRSVGPPRAALPTDPPATKRGVPSDAWRDPERVGFADNVGRGPFRRAGADEVAPSLDRNRGVHDCHDRGCSGFR